MEKVKDEIVFSSREKRNKVKIMGEYLCHDCEERSNCDFCGDTKKKEVS